MKTKTNKKIIKLKIFIKTSLSALEAKIKIEKAKRNFETKLQLKGTIIY